MRYMLIINGAVEIEDKETLEAFKSTMILESYNDTSRNISLIFNEYLTDVFERDQKLTKEVRTRIDDNLVPAVNIWTVELYQLQDIYFSLKSVDPDLKVKKTQQIVFKDLCDEIFKDLMPLSERLDL